MGMTNKRAGALILFFLVAAVTVYIFLGGSPSIALDFGESSFIASVADYDVTVPYEQIISLELIEIPELGSPESGGEQRGFRYGTWRSEAWGSYAQCTTKQADICILIGLKDGGRFLLSIEGDAATRELCTMLDGLLRSKGVEMQ